MFPLGQAHSSATRSPSVEADLSDLAQGTGIALAGRLSGRFFDLIRQAIFARMVSTAEFGVFALALTIFRLVTMIGPLGVNSAILRFASAVMDKPDDLRRVLRVGISLSILSGLLLGGLLFLSADFIATTVFRESTLSPLLYGFAIAAAWANIMRVCLSITTLRRRVSFLILIEEVVQPGLYLILLLVFTLIFHFNPMAAALTAVPFSFAVAALFAWRRVLHQFPTLGWGVSVPDPTLSVKLLRFGAPLTLASLFLWSTPLIDRLLVGIFLSSEVAGVYIVVAQLATFFTLIGAAIETIQSPIIAQLVHSPQPQRLARVSESSVRLGLLLGVPALVVLVIHSGTLLSVIFSPEYSAGASALLVLGAATILRVISDRAISVLVMSGHNRQWLIYSTLSFLLNLVMDLLLIPPLGMMGAALSTAAVNVFLLGALALILRRQFHISLLKPKLILVLPIMAVSILIGLIPTFIGWTFSPLLSLGVYSVLAGGVCLGLMWFFIIDADEHQLIGAQLNRRRKEAA